MDNTKKEDIFNKKRIFPVASMMIMTFLYTVMLVMIKNVYLDEAVCIVFLDLIFLLILFFELDQERRKKLLSYNISTTYGRVSAGYCISCVIIVISAFGPEYACPILFIPLMMCSLSNEIMAMITGIFLCIIMELTVAGSVYELINYIMLVVLGSVLARSLKEKKYRPFVSILLVCINIIIPSVCYYWQHGATNIKIYIYGLVYGLVNAGFGFFFFEKFRDSTEQELKLRLWDLISDDNSIVKDVKAYSKAEYQHAKLVSDIAMKYANELELPMSLCAAAGFYYRLGKWQGGEDYVNAGVKRAIELGFPADLIAIISEYNGEKKRPSSPESAIIHMIDAVTIKMEVLNSNVSESDWNREMLIYQTLNDFSNDGLYDESGLSMNQFLRIREYLCREERLL